MTTDETIALARFIVDADKEVGKAMGLPIGDDRHLARTVLSLHEQVERMRAVVEAAQAHRTRLNFTHVCLAPCTLCALCVAIDALDTATPSEGGR